MSSALARATRRPLVLVTILVTAAFLAAGCGGSDSGSSSSKSDDSGSSSKTSSTTSDGGGGSSDATGRFCGDGTAAEDVAKRADAFDDAPTGSLDDSKQYHVTVKTSAGTFTIDLAPKKGPKAAANFAFLVRNCFYDGVVFHRIIKGFMVQTGDPTGTGTGGPGYTIKDDEVGGTYARGTVAMANAGPDTGGSQFFIVQGDAVQLPPNYAIFGKVDDDGMKIVDKIADTPTEQSPSGEQSSPTKPVTISSATISES